MPFMASLLLQGLGDQCVHAQQLQAYGCVTNYISMEFRIILHNINTLFMYICMYSNDNMHTT